MRKCDRNLPRESCETMKKNEKISSLNWECQGWNVRHEVEWRILILACFLTPSNSLGNLFLLEKSSRENQFANRWASSKSSRLREDGVSGRGWTRGQKDLHTTKMRRVKSIFAVFPAGWDFIPRLVWFDAQTRTVFVIFPSSDDKDVSPSPTTKNIFTITNLVCVLHRNFEIPQWRHRDEEVQGRSYSSLVSVRRR